MRIEYNRDGLFFERSIGKTGVEAGVIGDGSVGADEDCGVLGAEVMGERFRERAREDGLDAGREGKGGVEGSCIG